MDQFGSFTFVLHSHLPYARQAGRWPHGEEWLHEAAAETYIPLLNSLYRLRAERIPIRLTLSLTPILVEQLSDEDVKANFVLYIEDRIRAAEVDVERFTQSNETHSTDLAKFYLDWYHSILESFQNTYQYDLISAFRRLQDEGIIEIITCAATHAYLPLLSRDESINLQLRTAVESYKRHFGRLPRGIWLPECAYRPAYINENGDKRAGLEDFLHRHSLTHFFTETHMIEGGAPVGLAAGDALGPYGSINRRYLVPFSSERPSSPASTYHAYFVSKPEVAVIGRNNQTGLQVWSAEWGYPGDYEYREFHKKDGVSGMQYWRVTGADSDLSAKELYHPEKANSKVVQHAEHFSRMVREMLEEYQRKSGSYGLIAAIYDTELFGHWWFEGVGWLENVLRHLATSKEVQLTTAEGYLGDNPAETVLNLPEGSWGAGGNHFVWDNVDTSWMWPLIHQAEDRMREIVLANPTESGEARHALDQAARELLLLQSSDWPFLVTTGQAKEYAIKRFQDHLDRFNRLLDQIVDKVPSESFIKELWERDKIFPEIDYRWYRQ